jgi:hypothetical protein
MPMVPLAVLARNSAGSIFFSSGCSATVRGDHAHRQVVVARDAFDHVLLARLQVVDFALAGFVGDEGVALVRAASLGLVDQVQGRRRPAPDAVADRVGTDRDAALVQDLPDALDVSFEVEAVADCVGLSGHFNSFVDGRKLRQPSR